MQDSHGQILALAFRCMSLTVAVPSSLRSGLGFQVNGINRFQAVPSSLGCGPVFGVAHRPRLPSLYHSTLGLRVTKKKRFPERRQQNQPLIFRTTSDQIAFCRSLTCTSSRRNSATFGTNQSKKKGRKEKFAPPLRKQKKSLRPPCGLMEAYWSRRRQKHFGNKMYFT